MLLFGQFSRESLASVHEAAEQAACVLTHAETLEEALTWLESHPAHGILCGSESAEQLSVQTRSRAALAKVPMLALAPELTDLAFASAVSCGTDELVQLGATRALAARLRALPKEAPSPPVEQRGTVLVAEADRVRRVAVARVLRNAGFAVRFAVSPEDTAEFACDPSLELAVASRELLQAPRETIERARAAGSLASFVLCAAPRELREERAALAGLASVTVTDGFAAPENVLFVANELTSGRRNNRASARIAYGTRVAFRGAGRPYDDVGFTYNLSETGIYVRTLAPPEDDEVWVELCPPLLERQVRLVGRVAWRRPFNYNQSATVPPGFGLQIVDGFRKDRELWKDSYQRLLEALG